jgi:hypothetical protein
LNSNFGHRNIIANEIQAIIVNKVNQKAFNRTIRQGIVRSIKQLVTAVVNSRCRKCSIVGIEDLYRRIRINATKSKQLNNLSGTMNSLLFKNHKKIKDFLNTGSNLLFSFSPVQLPRSSLSAFEIRRFHKKTKLSAILAFVLYLPG